MFLLTEKNTDSILYGLSVNTIFWFTSLTIVQTKEEHKVEDMSNDN